MKIRKKSAFFRYLIKKKSKKTDFGIFLAYISAFIYVVVSFRNNYEEFVYFLLLEVFFLPFWEVFDADFAPFDEILVASRLILSASSPKILSNLLFEVFFADAVPCFG